MTKHYGIAVLVCCLCIALPILAQNVPGLPKSLKVKSNVKYPFILEDDPSKSCKYMEEPCAELSDIWGYEFEENGVKHHFAIVGMTNGVDIVDVTDPSEPKRVKFLKGCINMWRDMKAWGTTIYGISEYTQTCACPEGTPCLEHMEVTAPPEVAKNYQMTEGRQTPQLEEVGPINGLLVSAEPRDDKACDFISNGAELAGNIAIIDAGDCGYAVKILNAQQAGAIAVVIHNDKDDIIYPGMGGWAAYHDQITIPAVMIGLIDGNLLREHTGVQLVLDANNRNFSDLFSPPEGITIIDMSNPWEPKIADTFKQQFMHSHNVYVEDERPIMYVCGTSNGKYRSGAESWNYVANGGLVIYNVTSMTPTYIAEWNNTYIHDMMVKECDGKHYLYGAAIKDDDIYVWDASDPANLVQVLHFEGRQGGAHNIWVDDSCRVLYVTHERVNEPITVWKMFDTPDGQIDWNTRPKYLGSLTSNQFQGTLPHNVLVEGDVLWAAFYSEGVVAWNISQPDKPTLLAHYQTSQFEGGLAGVWGVYPFASTGLVYASDMQEGLFVMELVESEIPDVKEEESYKTLSIVLGVIGLLLILALIVAIVMYLKKSPYKRV